MFELGLRVLFALAAVLGLLWLISRLSAKGLGANRGSVMTVVGRQSVGRNASLAVVSVGERVLVVGVSEQGVRLLTELEPDEIELPVAKTVAAEETATAESAVDAGFETMVDTTGTTAGEVETIDRMKLGRHRPAVVSAGSVLAPQTWRQAWAAVTNRTGTRT